MDDFACENPQSLLFINIGAYVPYDTLKCSQHHKLHLRAKIDVNRPIFIELWPGKVWWCDGVFWSDVIFFTKIKLIMFSIIVSIERLIRWRHHIKILYRTRGYWRACHGGWWCAMCWGDIEIVGGNCVDNGRTNGSTDWHIDYCRDTKGQICRTVDHVFFDPFLVGDQQFDSKLSTDMGFAGTL